MKIFYSLLIVLSWTAGMSMAYSRDLGIVPEPVSAVEEKGVCDFSRFSDVVSENAGLEGPASIFKSYVGDFMAHSGKGAHVRLSVDGSLGKEEYRLHVRKSSISVCGGDAAGVFYGLQTLRQLVVSNSGKIPCVSIEDKPAMEYRGTMLDVCRHFFTVDEVKKFIDIMALHKLNKFHWHLTEDQGWRIEIKKYPLLTEVGSRRSGTIVGMQRKGATAFTDDGKEYGGYYTQDQIRDVVKYAADRYIEVIPEIEMPGHGLGALTAYPWLGCTGGPYSVWTHWGISDDVYCAGKETTFEFVENVLSEVIDLFPSKFIHIGGDECPKGRWKECPLCQKRMADEDLKDENQLQSYFIHRVEKWLHDNGRELIGWDEILQGGISSSAIIMTWRDQFNGTGAVQRGNRVIMTPKWNCYFDYSQTSGPDKNEGLTNVRYLPVRQVYRLDPYDRLKPSEWEYVLGVQANVWTEYIADFDKVQFKVLPRLAALAERGWSYNRSTYDDFVRRLFSLRKTYDACGYIYAGFIFDGIE